MTQVVIRRLFRFFSIAICLQMLVPSAGAKPHPEHPYRYSVLDIPVSLALGTIQSPEFTTPKTQGYWILMQIDRSPSSPRDLDCMMSTAAIPFQGDTCHEPRLLQAEWTVWENGKAIESGSSTNDASAKYTAQYIFKLMGNFQARKGAKYIVEIKFTKDGTALNLNSPHLIVVAIGEE